MTDVSGKLAALLRHAAEFVHDCYTFRCARDQQEGDSPFNVCDYYNMESLEKELWEALLDLERVGVPRSPSPAAPVCDHCGRPMREAWLCVGGSERGHPSVYRWVERSAPPPGPSAPTEADEPLWEGWFSCEDCGGWFNAVPVAYDSGAEVCNGCAAERDRRRLKSKRVGSERAGEAG